MWILFVKTGVLPKKNLVDNHLACLIKQGETFWYQNVTPCLSTSIGLPYELSGLCFMKIYLSKSPSCSAHNVTIVHYLEFTVFVGREFEFNV